MIFPSNDNLLYSIYNILTLELKHFGSKTEFSKYFSNSRNDKLWDYFNENKLVDFNFNCLQFSIESIENFLNSNIKLQESNRSKSVNIKIFYEGLKENIPTITLAKKLGITRQSLAESYKYRSKKEWIFKIEKVITALPLNPFKIGKSINNG